MWYGVVCYDVVCCGTVQYAIARHGIGLCEMSQFGAYAIVSYCTETVSSFLCVVYYATRFLSFGEYDAFRSSIRGKKAMQS